MDDKNDNTKLAQGCLVLGIFGGIAIAGGIVVGMYFGVGWGIVAFILLTVLFFVYALACSVAKSQKKDE